MAAQPIKLPDDPVALAHIIRTHAERERPRYAARRAMWLLAWHYLNGNRRFDIFDPTSGRVTSSMLDREGNLEYQSQELLSAIDRISSRISSMDMRPRVVKGGTSLQAIRERSVAQLILDAIVPHQQVTDVASTFAHLLTTLGCCGIQGHVVDHPTIGLTADLEVVHPREVLPFPSLGEDMTRQAGIMRQRIVPLDWLEERFSKSKISKQREKMEWWEVEYGEDPGDPDGNGLDLHSTWGKGSAPGGGDPAATSMGVARIRELWIDGPRGTCSRYIIASGDAIIQDEDLSNSGVYCPLGWARFLETGSFYGAGAFDLLFGISRELEKLLKSLFANVRDSDRYGIVVMPAGALNDRAVLRDVGRGLRAVSYQPDPLNEKFSPFVIQPHNLGDTPGKVANLAKQMMQSISPVQDLIQEKGRVDSATGLQFLDEQITRAMTTPTMAVERCLGAVYRSVLSSSGRYLLTSQRALPVSTLTTDLAGALINLEEGSVSFQNNPLPDVSKLSFAIKQASPRSEVARKQEAAAMIQAGIQDPMAFKLLAFKEGLDVAAWLDDDKAAYDTVVRNILLLYGDGSAPGQLVLTPHSAKPDLQLRVLASFMTGPQMVLAAPEVQDAFKGYREALIQFLGQTLPQSMPLPEEAAAMGMQGPPGAPPGAPPGMPPGGPGMMPPPQPPMR